MAEDFISVELQDIVVGEPLPVPLYVYIDFRFITYRADGDTLDRKAYDRMQFRKIRNLFVLRKDHPAFQKWGEKFKKEAQNVPPLAKEKENKEFKSARDDVARKTLDIFQSEHPDKIVAQTIVASKKLVSEVMKMQFAVTSLSQLQTYSQGTVDHSVNVSILSVYLAMQMGYTHTLILQHIGMGGLLHDIGKSKVNINESDSPEMFEKKMKDHPTLGSKLIDGQSKIAKEVKMIIEQHHECHDGTGYPKKLRGSSSIYDLARIVSIANTFDELVGEGQGSLVERQKSAILKLDQNLFKRFDPQKLEKALKILKLGI
jgi:putative nucleotidyltransferase with HDIG domain